MIYIKNKNNIFFKHKKNNNKYISFILPLFFNLLFFAPNSIKADAYSKIIEENGTANNTYIPNSSKKSVYGDQIHLCTGPSSGYYVTGAGFSFTPHMNFRAPCTPKSSVFTSPTVSITHTFKWFGVKGVESVSLNAFGGCKVMWATGLQRVCARFYKPRNSDLKQCNINLKEDSGDTDPIPQYPWNPKPYPNLPDICNYDWEHHSYICVFDDVMDLGDLQINSMPFPLDTPKSLINEAAKAGKGDLSQIPIIGPILGNAFGGVSGLALGAIGFIFSKISFLSHILNMNEINHTVFENLGCVIVPLAPYPPAYSSFARVELPKPSLVPICRMSYSGKIKMQQVPQYGEACEYGNNYQNSNSGYNSNSGTIPGNPSVAPIDSIFYSTFSKPSARLTYNNFFKTSSQNSGVRTLNICDAKNSTNCVNNYDSISLCTQPNATSSSVPTSSLSGPVGLAGMTTYIPNTQTIANSNNNCSNNQDVCNNSIYHLHSRVVNNNGTSVATQTSNQMRIIYSNSQSSLGDFKTGWLSGSNSTPDYVSRADTVDLRYEFANSEDMTNMQSNTGITFSVSNPYINQSTHQYNFSPEAGSQDSFCVSDASDNSGNLGCIERASMPMPVVAGFGLNFPQQSIPNAPLAAITYLPFQMEIYGPQDSALAPYSSLPANSEASTISANLCNQTNSTYVGLIFGLGDDISSFKTGCVSFDTSLPFPISPGNINSANYFLINNNSNQYKNAYTYIHGVPFSILPADEFNTPYSISSSGSYLVGNYINESGQKINLTNSNSNLSNIISALQQYVSTPSGGQTLQVQDSNSNPIYYVGGIEYASQGENLTYYIRGATKLCLQGYNSQDTVLTTPNQMRSATAFTQASSTNINMIKGIRSNILLNQALQSNMFSCDSSTPATRENSQYCAISSSGKDNAGCQITYDNNYLISTNDLNNILSPSVSNDSEPSSPQPTPSYYIGDRILPVILMQNQKPNSQYIDATYAQLDNNNSPVPYPIFTNTSPLLSIIQNTPAFGKGSAWYRAFSNGMTRNKIPQELGVCVDLPVPQCAITPPNNQTPSYLFSKSLLSANSNITTQIANNSLTLSWPDNITNLSLGQIITISPNSPDCQIKSSSQPGVSYSCLNNKQPPNNIPQAISAICVGDPGPYSSGSNSPSSGKILLTKHIKSNDNNDESCNLSSMSTSSFVVDSTTSSQNPDFYYQLQQQGCYDIIWNLSNPDVQPNISITGTIITNNNATGQNPCQNISYSSKTVTAICKNKEILINNLE